MVKIESPTLARYRPITNYVPRVGDFVVWSGWLQTWYAVVSGYDDKQGMVVLVHERTPRLLCTLTPAEAQQRTSQVSLADIQGWRRGHWYVCQTIDGQPVWYV